MDPTVDDRLQLGQAFQRRVTQALIPIDDDVFALSVRRFDRHDFAIEAAVRPRLCRFLLRCKSERVDVVARDAAILGDALGAFELVRHVERPSGREERAAGGA